MIKGVDIPVLSPFKFYPAGITTGNGVVFQNVDNTNFPDQSWSGVYPVCFIQPVARVWYDNSPGIDFQVYLDSSYTDYADLSADIIDLDGNVIYALTKDDFFYFETGIVDIIQVRFYSASLSSVDDGYYRIKIYEDGGDDYYYSEIIEIATTHENCYPLQYSNFENDFGLIYTNTDDEEWVGKILIPMRQYKPIISGERESYQDDNGVLTTLRTLPVRSYEFETLPVTTWFAEKVKLIFSNSILKLNKLSVNSENLPEIEIISESDLMNITGEVQLNSFPDGYFQDDEVATYTYITPDITKQTYVSDGSDTGGDKNVLMPRICLNPVNDNLVEVFRVGADHVGSIGTMWMRFSDDDGATWTGVGGSGNITEILTESAVDLRNYGAFYTPTGRLVVTYQRYVPGTSTWLDSKSFYSDNDGASWSTPVVFASPGVEANRSAGTYSNRCVLDASGDLLIPVNYTDATATGSKIFIAKSTDNGATWNTSYKLALDIFASGYRAAEPVIEDFGSGKFVIIARTIYYNAAGHNAPIMLYSDDYGENWAGSSETLSITDINAGNHNSGYAYLEGAGVTLGTNTNSEDCLPDIINMTINGASWIVIPYWIRNNGVVTYIQRMTIIKFTEYAENGLDSIKTPLTIDLFDGFNTDNGGNGSSVVIGNEILYTVYEQTTVFSGATCNLYTFFIDNDILSQISTNYNVL